MRSIEFFKDVFTKFRREIVIQKSRWILSNIGQPTLGEYISGKRFFENEKAGIFIWGTDYAYLRWSNELRIEYRTPDETSRTTVLEIKNGELHRYHSGEWEQAIHAIYHNHKTALEIHAHQKAELEKEEERQRFVPLKDK